MKIKIIVFIVCVVFWVLLFVLLFSGCSFLQGNAQNANYKLLYVNSQIQLANTQSLLNKSAAELKEMRESEKILRNSLDSLYKYTDEKTDSLYSVIAIKIVFCTEFINIVYNSPINRPQHRINVCIIRSY